MKITKAALLSLAFFGAALLRPHTASAIPLFAHQYGVTCEKCHSVIPHLNEFGAAFMANGDRIPGLKAGAVSVPFSAKVNLVDSSERQGEGPDGEGLPKAIVDEIEAFTAGTIGNRGSFFAEQYVVDGGMPGLTRDAWVFERLNPWDARIPVSVQAGAFTLPLLVDPESLRDSAQHYASYDQAVGGNPFTFFDTKIGARLSIGDPLRGLNAQLFAGPGHDRQSGLSTVGVDTMGYAQDTMGLLTLATFRYQGSRALEAAAPWDQFERTGYSAAWNQYGRFTLETELQTGYDSVCGGGILLGCASSGGFAQARYQFNRRLYVLGRYEGTSDSIGGFSRDGVVLLGWGPTENTRVTIEDVVQHTPQTTHTMNLQFTAAY